jgi:Sec-independent protein translocase protein TatA
MSTETLLILIVVLLLLGGGRLGLLSMARLT